MRTLARTFITPLVACAIALACVSFAVATSHQTVPRATDKVYPCIPDHTGGHGGDYGDWHHWWTWLKSKYGDHWANSVKAKYGAGLDKYVQDKYSGASATTTYFGGSSYGGGGGHHGGGDPCEPDCPDGGYKSKSTSTTTYGGGHHDDDECDPDCPKSASSQSTSTYGGSHGGGGHDDDDDPMCCPPKSSASTYGGSHGGGGYGDHDDDPKCCPPTSSATSYTTTTSGGGHSGGDKCDPPDADTGGCGTCKATTITVSGTVDPNGNATQYKFEFGTTPAFGHETDWESAGDGTSTRTFTETLDGLAPGTKIYYRIVAKSSRGTSNGATRYCTTAGASKPSAVTGGTSSLKAVSSTINGTVDPNGLATAAYFQYGKTSSLGTSTGSQSIGSGDSGKSVSAGLSGLTPNTKYYYRVVATNSKGTAYGEIKSFTTPYDAPKCTTGGYGSVSKSGGKVNGTVNPGGGSTSYYFEYGKSSSLGSKSGSVSAGSGVSNAAAAATLSGLSSNTKYYYRVVAVNGNGTATGATQSFTTAK